MKVILLENIKGKGKKDEIIEVADGYGLHLIREKKAIEASKGGMKILNQQIEARQNEHKILEEQALKDKQVLEAKSLEFQLKVGKDGKVFKSVSHKQIVDKIYEEYQLKVDKRKFKSKDSINTLGVTNVELELYKGVVATIKVAIKEA